MSPMDQTLNLLVGVFFNLYITFILLRFLLQMVKADFSIDHSAYSHI